MQLHSNPQISFALVSVYVFVVTALKFLTTLKFLSKETSGIFIIQIVLNTGRYSSGTKVFCSVIGVVCYSWWVLGNTELASILLLGKNAFCTVVRIVKEVSSSPLLCNCKALFL